MVAKAGFGSRGDAARIVTAIPARPVELFGPAVEHGSGCVRPAGAVAHGGRAQRGLDLSLGHLRTTRRHRRRESTPTGALPDYRPMHWVVWLLQGNVWRQGPTLPDGAAQSYVAGCRMVAAMCLESASG
jgi:hypothetical protein